MVWLMRPALLFGEAFLIAAADLRFFKAHSMASPPLPPKAFISASELMLQRTPELRIITERRRSRALFGATSSACPSAWRSMRGSLPRTADAPRLLWDLLFLKAHSRERVSSANAGVDENAFRKWRWVGDE